MIELPDLSLLSHAEKDALIRALWAALQASECRNAELAARLSAAERRIAELEARLNEPAKRPDNSSLPPSCGQKSNRSAKGPRKGPRKGSLGRQGGGRALAENPDQTVIAKAVDSLGRRCHDGGYRLLHGPEGATERKSSIFTRHHVDAAVGTCGMFGLCQPCSGYQLAANDRLR